MEKEKSGFGGILNKLKGAIFTQEYLDTQESGSEAKSTTPSTNSTSSNTEVNKPQIVTPKAASINYANVPQASQDEMIHKVRSLLEGMNKPGIDFFELWNAAEAMGSINTLNVNNAYVALKIASGNTLSKATILETGQFYSDNLKTALENDVKGKMSERNSIMQQKAQMTNSLGQEITDLNNKIAEMQKQLQEKNSRLVNIDQEFDPKVKEIEQKIAVGQTAVQTVVTQINQVLELVKTSINA